MHNGHHHNSENGSSNGNASHDDGDIYNKLDDLKIGREKTPSDMPKDVGLMLTLLGSGVTVISITCLYFDIVRMIAIGLLLLALGGILAKENEPDSENSRYQKLLLGLVIVPVVLSSFFFMPVAEFVFIFCMQFGLALTAYGMLGDRLLRFKNYLPYVVFIITLVIVLVLNFQNILNRFQRVGTH